MPVKEQLGALHTFQREEGTLVLDYLTGTGHIDDQRVKWEKSSLDAAVMKGFHER